VSSNATTSTTSISLLRHGDVEGGACYRGITDDPLSDLGWQQMQHSIEQHSSNWDLIISSPLVRCAAFAQRLSKTLNIPITYHSELQEINFGDWEGKIAEQIDAQSLALFYADPSKNPPPNGESFTTFQRRILLTWQHLLQRHMGKNILLISHAGVIRVILANILALDTEHSFKLKIGHAYVSRVECIHSNQSKDFFQLISHG